MLRQPAESACRRSCLPARRRGSPVHGWSASRGRRCRTSVRYVGYVDPAKRRELYEGAKLLVQPSFEEGFGLPVLEAMTVGVPVVAANRGALPEVLGDAGPLVDPEDAAGFAEAIDTHGQRSGRGDVSDDARLGASARSFSWDRTALAMISAYKAAVTASRGTRRRLTCGSASTRASSAATAPASAAISTACCSSGPAASRAPPRVRALRPSTDRGPARRPRFPTRLVAGRGGTRWEQQQLLPRRRARPSRRVLRPGYTAPLFARVPMVVAIHDVSFAAHPEWFSAREGLAAPARDAPSRHRRARDHHAVGVLEARADRAARRAGGQDSRHSPGHDTPGPQSLARRPPGLRPRDLRPPRVLLRRLDLQSPPRARSDPRLRPGGAIASRMRRWISSATIAPIPAKTSSRPSRASAWTAGSTGIDTCPTRS